MYRKIEPPLGITMHEAQERYADSFMVFRMDSRKAVDDVGSLLYVGDNRREIYSIAAKLSHNMLFCGTIEGLDHQRSCLGGVVIHD